jgi:CRISPR-associated endonuclease/helicase Cas3/CRISPR-associated endonuclease Cas3-HD
VDSAVSVGGVYGRILTEVGSVDEVEPDAVADAVASTDGKAILHLSTRLRPADRLKLVATAKELTKRGHPLVGVSTQLVEAGVDISFGHVYRDLAPVDSIVQAAGRCNRSFEYERGRVTVWWLDAPGEQTKTPAQAVYNRDVRLLPVAAKTLASVRADDGSLSESAVARTAVKSYYDRLKSEKKVGENNYVDYVDEARGDELARLSLIDQRRTVDILVCRTPDERALVESIRIAERNFDFDRLSRLLEKSKSLRISVPIYERDSETAKAVEQLPVLIEDRGLYELDSRQHDSHFDDVTGFVTPENSVDNRFL